MAKKLDSRPFGLAQGRLFAGMTPAKEMRGQAILIDSSAALGMTGRNIECRTTTNTIRTSKEFRIAKLRLPRFLKRPHNDNSANHKGSCYLFCLCFTHCSCRFVRRLTISGLDLARFLVSVASSAILDKKFSAFGSFRPL